MTSRAPILIGFMNGSIARCKQACAPGKHWRGSRLMFVLCLSAMLNLFAMSAHAEVDRAGYLGIGVTQVPKQLRAHLPEGISNTPGVLVTWLADDSPAADDGVKKYDVLLEFEGKPIERPEKFIYQVMRDKPGRNARIKLVRQGEVKEVVVKLGEKKAGDSQKYDRVFPLPKKRKRTVTDKIVLPGTKEARQMAALATPRPLSIIGKPAAPMRKKIVKEKHAWGDERHIWPDFYTKSTEDIWDNMINAPFKMGRMPGGWRAPSLTSPDPITIGDAVLNQAPPFLEEAGNMAHITDDNDN